MLPNFLLIGANKAGTSALHQLLDGHPQIFMSPVKEPSYFALDGPPAVGGPDGNFVEHMVWDREAYERLFEGVVDEVVVGESSTIYFASETAPERIHAEVPDAKLLVVLRDPSDRARSAHDMYVANGFEDLGLVDAVEAELAGSVWRKYVRLSRYADSLERYRALFGDQLKVVIYRDFRQRPRETVSEIFEWLGVDPDVPVDVDRQVNVWKVPRSRLKRLVGRIPGLRRAAGRGADPEVRRHLIEILEDDIERVEDLLDQDLAHWREV